MAMILNSPVIVIGSPRSGTTTVARVMQNWLGIVMDASPMKPDKVINPYGWYEDSRLVEMNRLYYLGMIKLNAWARRFKRYIRAMEKLDRPWGFKDPRIIPVFGYALSFFKSPTIIRVRRDRKLVIASQMGKLGRTAEKAERLYDKEQQALDRTLNHRDHYLIDFAGGVVSEEQILGLFEATEVTRNV